MKNVYSVSGTERLLTSHEVSQLLQVNASSVKKWVDEGRIPAFRTPGGHRRIRRSDLLGFLDAHKMPVPRGLERSGPPRLVIVDDDTLYLRSLGRLLKTYTGLVDARLIDNGIDALLEIGSFQPDLVVLDVFMPEVDGIEVCRRLHANPQTSAIDVIVTSGQLTAELEAKALRSGARSCLPKPIPLEVMLEAAGLKFDKATPESPR